MITCACPVQDQKFSTENKIKVFKLLLDTYIYSAARGTYVPLPNMSPEVPAQLCAAAKALRGIEQGNSQAANYCLAGAHPGVAF